MKSIKSYVKYKICQKNRVVPLKMKIINGPFGKPKDVLANLNAQT